MADPASRLSEFFESVRQGHIFSLADGSPTGVSKRFVVVSQTCDVVLPKRPTVSLAQVVELDGDDRSQAAVGTSPRHVALPSLGDKYFADLCYVESRAKEDLVDAGYVPGIDLRDEQIKRNFTLAITRWFGRFPFPNEVVPWLHPLEQVVREKYRKQSALGDLLRDVIVEIRVEEAGQWQQAPYRLEVHTIVRAEALPTLPADAPPPAEFVSALRELDDNVKAPSALAEIFATTADLQQRQHVLLALAESFAARCEPTGKYAEDEAVKDVVTSVEWQLWGDDEFPLSRVRKSEPLDLEYLSSPEERP